MIREDPHPRFQFCLVVQVPGQSLGRAAGRQAEDSRQQAGRQQACRQIGSRQAGRQAASVQAGR